MLITVMNSSFAQKLVSTTPSNKVVVLERFTGVRCGGCPAVGHYLDSIVYQVHKGNGIMVNFHPLSLGHYVAPYPDSSYAIYRKSASYLYSVIVNSVPVGDYILNRKNWWLPNSPMGMWCWADTDVVKMNRIIPEISPVNIGLESHYDSISKTLTINAELYYTSNVNNKNGLVILLKEAGVHANQNINGLGFVDHVHEHLFRDVLSHTGALGADSMTLAYGDSVGASFTQGQLVKKQYTFVNGSTGEEYNIKNCTVMAYVIDPRAKIVDQRVVVGEVYTGIEVKADGGTTASTTTAITNMGARPGMEAQIVSYDNFLTIKIQNTNERVDCNMYNVLGEKINFIKESDHLYKVDKNMFPAGIYIYNVSNKEGKRISGKFIIN